MHGSLDNGSLGIEGKFRLGVDISKMRSHSSDCMQGTGCARVRGRVTARVHTCLGACEELRRKRFVDVKEIHVGDPQPCLAQCRRDGGHRANAHAGGLNANAGIRDELTQWGEPMLLHRSLARNDQRTWRWRVERLVEWEGGAEGGGGG